MLWRWPGGQQMAWPPSTAEITLGSAGGHLRRHSIINFEIPENHRGPPLTGVNPALPILVRLDVVWKARPPFDLRITSHPQNHDGDANQDRESGRHGGEDAQHSSHEIATSLP